ncbi:MAG: glucose-6-phosphate isomerase [Deltaproteobacteria bacterium]|nr:glucose-6-phosphate isomerase [Deltaproteobacteria bacterium]
MADYRRKRWRGEMAVRVDVNGALDALIGPGGLQAQDLESLQPRVAQAHDRLGARRSAKELRFRDLPYEKREVQKILELARELRSEVDTLVVLGIGGSALGARALYQALCPPFHDHQPGTAERGVRLLIADTVDPSTFGALLDEVDPHRTAFNVISKSGETAETMSQFLIVRERLLRTLGAVDYSRHLVITTDADAGALRQIVNDEGLRSLAVPPGVAGRYSVLTAVALLPAAVAGIDVTELLAGAAAMDERCAAPSLFENPAYLHGAVHYLAHVARQKTVQVLMPYCDGLRGLADWFVQLWAESLGKAVDVDGQPLHGGQTPVAALGASDQHTRLQLFAEGPNDKILTFVRVDDHGARLDVPRGYGDLESVAYLGGRTLGDLLNLEQRATEASLAALGRMSTTLHVPRLNAFTLGQLFYLLEVQTVFVATLHRLDPFNQPGIEPGKRLIYGLAGRRGYEEKRAEVEAWMQKKNPRYVI